MKTYLISLFSTAFPVWNRKHLRHGGLRQLQRIKFYFHSLVDLLRQISLQNEINLAQPTSENPTLPKHKPGSWIPQSNLLGQIPQAHAFGGW